MDGLFGDNDTEIIGLRVLLLITIGLSLGQKFKSFISKK